MIGDSYFALSETTSPPAGEITKELLSLASSAGALATGDSYRYYYESGANMATTYSSTITPIPTQFANAVKANPDIKYVIMDGGGNDILLENTDCIKAAAGTPISSQCQTVVQNAISAATTLFQAMKAAGVEKVVYFFYPHLPTTNFPSVNAILDYSFPLLQAACEASPVPCYLVDTRAAFNGNDATYIGPDDIHPTTAGSDAIAKLLWGQMTQACVALSP
jgi:phospholipase/lecithinase/hemolysin